MASVNVYIKKVKSRYSVRILVAGDTPFSSTFILTKKQVVFLLQLLECCYSDINMVGNWE